MEKRPLYTKLNAVIFISVRFWDTLVAKPHRRLPLKLVFLWRDYPGYWLCFRILSDANLWNSPHGFQATRAVGVDTSKVDRSASSKPDRSGGEVIGTIGQLSAINPWRSYQAATSTLTTEPRPTASGVMLHTSGLDSFNTAASQHETGTPGFIYRSSEKRLHTTVPLTTLVITSKTRGEIRNERLTVSPSASLPSQDTSSIVLTSGSGKNTYKWVYYYVSVKSNNTPPPLRAYPRHLMRG